MLRRVREGEMGNNLTGIIEVISPYIRLKKVGDKYLGLCPFHEENTPSFTVDDGGGVFHCFGCLVGGNAVNFIDLVESRNIKPLIH